MHDQKKINIGFLPSFAIVLLGLSVMLIADSRTWGTAWGVKVFGLGVTVVAVAGYFLWRGYYLQAKLIRTGLEWIYAFCFLVVLASWILSSDPRQGFSRIGLFLAYFLLFYILTDAFEASFDRKAVIAALLTFSGLIIFMAALETYFVYYSWWAAVGSWKILPPYPYRIISLVGHSNSLMGLANLCAPLAVLAFIRVTKRTQRILLAFWLVSFFLIILFTSSRGGWLGTVVWVGIMFLWVFQKKNLYLRWKSLSKRVRVISVLFGSVALCAAVVVASSVVLQFVQHPSHGTDVLGGREQIWLNALHVWQANPWFGTGPGRFGFGYLVAVKNIPPGFWALHAHSLPIQILGEFGLMGAIALASLGIGSIFLFIQRYRLMNTEQKEWGIVIFAGAAAWCVQSLVDDQSNEAIVMTILIGLFAWFISLPDTPIARWHQVKNSILVIPFLILGLGSGWLLWAYAPFATGMTEIQRKNPELAAQYFEISTNRDPNMSFYFTQKGYALARSGILEANEQSLLGAHQSITRSLLIEPDISLFYANMAVADWNSQGLHSRAIPNMEYAISISPYEPSYYINLGRFYESENEQDAAIEAYSKALTLSPTWSNHPFWEINETRQMAISTWLATNFSVKISDDLYWVKARKAVEVGNLDQAELYLYQSDWIGESPIAIEVSRGLLAEKRMDQVGMINASENVAKLVNKTNLESPHQFLLTYTVWMNKNLGIVEDLVPGYVRLEQDVGQFDALHKLYNNYHALGDCTQANRIWEIWQQANQGGSLEPFPATPICP